MSKRITVEAFRKRLNEMIARAGLSRAAFARKSGLDRSTLTQLLAENAVRLPRTETIVALARPHNVSLDWLLGLTDEGSLTAEFVSQAAIEPDAASPTDERLKRWHGEAQGFKVRYVPATLPDQIKTAAIIAWETRAMTAAMAQSWTDNAESRIAHAETGNEIEVCSPLQRLELFAKGEGIWQGLPVKLRRRQLEHASNFVRERYPAYRWFLFDERERFSVPYTVFGQKRVAVYAGSMYLVFTSSDHIRALTSHFEDLIRQATIQPHQTAAHLKNLAGNCA
ncbi:MAG: helix-turn-helix transcriptional regulator [Aestuariivirgaceae bacterium]|nr:helix-turn-helix transcriptional regulator [Aestuariivirgaceae bacterium]